MTTPAIAYATDSPTSPFRRIEIERRALGPKDVLIDIAFAGICHSDLHTARGEWGPVTYPLVPGHEIAGVVREVGDAVGKYERGDRVGVGCYVDSCGECEQCRDHHEQFCTGSEESPGTIWTYDGTGRDGKPTHGGYSTSIVVDEDYVLRIPDPIQLDQAAPLLCAGITMYSPLRLWGAGPGSKVAIIGMGGLGHMGVQLAAAMGAEVHVISQTRSKEEDALRFGAAALHATSEEGTLRGLRGTFDLMISTISDTADLSRHLRALKPRGVLANVGLPEHPFSFGLGPLVNGAKVLAGSQIGGIRETQEMLDFCAQHGLAAQVEVIGGEDITAAYDRVVGSQVRYRYVIDTATF